MFSYQINNSYNEYLSDCDLINKYVLKSLETKPRIKTVLLEFPLQETSEKISDLQLKSYILVNLLVSFLPFISFKNLNSSLNKSMSNSNSCSLKLKLSNSKNINFFFIFLFFETCNAFNSKSFCFFKENLNKSQNINFVSLNVPLMLFYEYKYLSNKLLDGVNLSTFLMKIKINFYSNLILKKNINLFKNLPLFWINK